MVTYGGAVMRKSAALQRIDESEWQRYVVKLAEKYKYAGTAEEARRAVDKALGNRPLTDLLYEMRRERPL